MNKAILIGNVGNDPQYRTFQNGGSVCQFPLATTKKGYQLPNGEKVADRTEWHNIVLNKGLAEVAQQYVRKGDKLYICGEIRSREYTDRQGIKRYITEIYGHEMEMLTPKGSRQDAPAAPAASAPAASAPAVKAPEADAAPAEPETNDLPF